MFPIENIEQFWRIFDDFSPNEWWVAKVSRFVGNACSNWKYSRFTGLIGLWSIWFVEKERFFRWRISTLFSIFWFTKVSQKAHTVISIEFFRRQGCWSRTDFRRFLNALFSNKKRPYCILSDLVEQYFCETDFNQVRGSSFFSDLEFSSLKSSLSRMKKLILMSLFKHGKNRSNAYGNMRYFHSCFDWRNFRLLNLSLL